MRTTFRLLSSCQPRPLLSAFRRQALLLRFNALILCLLLVPFHELNLMALPPLDVALSEPGEVEISWPDTGEDVSLETSDDFSFWQTYPGNPQLIDGKFRQPVPIGSDGGFFRLTGSEVDPTAPVYDQLPDTSPSLYPGESVSFTLSATDPAGLPVTFLAESLPLPAGASLNMATGEFSWSPTLSQTGNTTVTFLAFNGKVSGRLPVTFNVKVPPVGGETSLSGILLDTTDAVNNGNRPVVGATVSLLNVGVSAVSGADGRFLIPGVPSGLQVLDIATATALPAPDGSRYAGFREAITIVGGIPNNVERPIYMPRLAMGSLKKVEPNFTTKVENIDTGTSIVVPPHTAMMGEEEFTGELSISDVPEALAPAALPENLGFGQLVTIQPVGVTFASPVPITFKNVDQLPPGTETDIWSLDPNAGVFAVVGKGRVTDDGQSIETIEGGVIAADWHGTLAPAIAAGDGPGSPGPTASPSQGQPPGPDGSWTAVSGPRGMSRGFECSLPAARLAQVHCSPMGRWSLHSALPATFPETW
ncbi:MAG: putative Ig domain-containing protein [Verrucomicrobiales bacterium]